MKTSFLTIFEIFSLGMPVIISLAGCLMILQAYRTETNKVGRIQHLRLLAFLLTLAGVWIGKMLCILEPDAFDGYFPIYSVILLLMPVTFWLYIRLLVSGKEHTAAWKHYVLPLLCCETIGVLQYLFPVSVITSIPDMLILNILHLAFSLVYGSLAISMLVARYRENHLFDNLLFSPGWLLVLTSIIGVQLLNVMLSVFTGEPESCADLPYTEAAALLVSSLISTLVYRVISMKSILTEETVGQEISKRKLIVPPPRKRRLVRKRSNRRKGTPAFSKRPELSRRGFEQYISKTKPWLDPKFSITELAGLLKTNRTYLSAFIKKEYGTNFNGWANDCRFKELEYLQSLPKYKDMPLRKLISMTGFGTYQGYYLARKRMQDKKVEIEEEVSNG